ncbi:MAG: KH domain-containing protein [Firmicutes bacterium]|nr:KH domain-containing protein [Bacillota bacterium]MDY5676206.1 KH domain-containing protein [Eubacteriales bacterium]
MEELVRYLLNNLVENPDQVDVSSKDESDKVTVITVKVAKDDIGRVIGRNGKVAGSIRTIVKSASAKTGKRYIVKIGERD